MIIDDRCYVDLYAETVEALTRAALRRNPDDSPSDFAAFLAQALAATAANVGGADRLVAGRAGSWEASYVDGLVRRTMGDQPDDWVWFRTQPVVIGLNVAELIEDERHHPGLMGLGEALENFDRQFATTDNEVDVDAWDRGIDTITARYTNEYRLYADRFTAAARRLADRIPGLSADVYVEADTNPDSTWWSAATTTNPVEYGCDQLAYELWYAAHDAIPLPNVDVWLGSGQPTAVRE
ncbi:MAG TPA: hypothetical protein VEX66_11370 [Microlunatus sp.]|jgi:hypothetical protein|nr:hypothetical protein [Microlunatus sp.]